MRFSCLLLLPLLLLTACSGPAPRIIVVLFDTSGSTDTAELHARYAVLAERIALTAQPGDYVAGDRITAHSRASARLALEVQLPTFNWSAHNERTFKPVLSAARDSIRRQVEAVMSGPPSSCTDLLGAFDTAARLLRGRRASAASEKRLVIVSDMVQTCGSVNFLRERLTPERITQLVEGEQAAGRLPDLAGVQVWVAGAGTVPDLTRDRHIGIERFWQAYFAAAGATLSAARYGPTLLDWEEHTP